MKSQDARPTPGLMANDQQEELNIRLHDVASISTQID